MPTSLDHFRLHKNIFACPQCGGDLLSEEESIACEKGGHSYPVENGVPLLYVPTGQATEISDTIKGFYTVAPFPNYDELDDTQALIAKAERSVFGKMLQEQIPFNTNVLEVGCGTGQLSNYLGIPHRYVFGADLTPASLALAEKFKEENDLDRVGFYQMNLFRPVFKPESFHVVISNGVLHHTSDPREGFRSIGRLVKPGGYMVIGLYNTYGRLATDIRRIVFRMLGSGWAFLDPYLRKEKMSDSKRLAWFRDQYQNPHESKHTMGETIAWFMEDGFEVQGGIPALSLGEEITPNTQLFRKQPAGSAWDRFWIQAKFIFTGSREGGLYVVIGKKK